MGVKFSFATLATFEALWPVKVRVPQDGGGVEEQEFMARFRTLTPEEQAELDALPPKDKAFRALELGFIGLGPEEDAGEWTPELRDRLIRSDWVGVALMEAFGGFRLGIAAKNVETPPG